MKKVLCLVIATVMLGVVLSACSGGDVTPQEEAPDDSNITGYLKGTNSFGCELNGELTVIDMTGIELGSDKAFQIMSGDVKLTGTFAVTKFKIEFGNGDGSRTANIDMSELTFDTSRMDASALDPDKSIIVFSGYGTEISATSPSGLPADIEIQESGNTYRIRAVEGAQSEPSDPGTQSEPSDPGTQVVHGSEQRYEIEGMDVRADILYTQLSETTLTEDTVLDAGTLDCYTLTVIDLAGHNLTLTGSLSFGSTTALVVKDSVGTGQVDASQMQCSNVRQPDIEQEDKDVRFTAAVFAISFRNISFDQDAQGNPKCGLNIMINTSDDGKSTVLDYEYKSVAEAAEAYPELLKAYLFDPDASGRDCPAGIEGLEVTIDLTGMPPTPRSEDMGHIHIKIARGMTIHFVGTLHYEGATIKPGYTNAIQPTDSSEYAVIDLSGLTVTAGEGVGRDYNGEVFWFGEDTEWIKPDNMENLTTDGIKLFWIVDMG